MDKELLLIEKRTVWALRIVSCHPSDTRVSNLSRIICQTVFFFSKSVVELAGRNSAGARNWGFPKGKIPSPLPSHHHYHPITDELSQQLISMWGISFWLPPSPNSGSEGSSFLITSSFSSLSVSAPSTSVCGKGCHRSQAVTLAHLTKLASWHWEVPRTTLNKADAKARRRKCIGEGKRVKKKKKKSSKRRQGRKRRVQVKHCRRAERQ